MTRECHVRFVGKGLIDGVQRFKLALVERSNKTQSRSRNGLEGTPRMATARASPQLGSDGSRYAENPPRSWSMRLRAVKREQPTRDPNTPERCPTAFAKRR